MPEVALVLALYWVSLAGLAVWLYKVGLDLDRKIEELSKPA